jgi:hypothetical protein
MGMFAEVLAIGGFSPELAPWMEYPESYYAHTHTGTMVVRTLFGIVEGSSASREFARLLGIDDPWDFNQHKIDPDRIDFAALRTHLSTLSEWESGDYPAHLEALVAFACARFDLYFVPNG